MKVSTLAVLCSVVAVQATPVVNPSQKAFKNNKLRLVAFSETEEQWADPEALMDANIQFMDITDHPDLTNGAAETRSRHDALYPVPNEPRRQESVNELFSQIDTDRMEKRLVKLTSFQNRYYKSATGKLSSAWLKGTLEEIASESCNSVVVSEFKHSWSQVSLIAKFPGSLKTGRALPTVIVGSHQDTVRGGFFSDGVAPGADDDGSGTVTTLEAFTVLCESGFAPDYPVEFHFYSAEEAGLLGSQDVAHRYQRDKKEVIGMVQFDMTGYNKNNVYGIITDFVDPELTQFLKMLAETYGSLKVVETQCKYGCSDHASWTKAGFRSCVPFEGTFDDHSPYIHTKNDLVVNVDFSHMKQFVKLAVAFAVELSSQ